MRVVMGAEAGVRANAGFVNAAGSRPKRRMIKPMIAFHAFNNVQGRAPRNIPEPAFPETADGRPGARRERAEASPACGAECKDQKPAPAEILFGGSGIYASDSESVQSRQAPY